MVFLFVNQLTYNIGQLGKGIQYSALEEISVESHMHYKLSDVPLHTIPLMLRIIMIGK